MTTGKLRKFAAQSAIVVGICLVLDLVIAQLVPITFLDPGERAAIIDRGVNDFTVSYHHALKPNVGPIQRQFGYLTYPFRTDRFGFRTGTCAGDDPVAAADTSVFVVGDSFTEGSGVAFEQTFAGLMACEWKKRGLTVWNLGVQGYSPLIEYYRLLDAERKTRIKPREVFLFLDISDIPDEAFVYEEKDGKVVYTGDGVNPADAWAWRRDQIGSFLQRHSIVGALANMLRLVWEQHGATDYPRGRWTTDPAEMQDFGNAGLAVAAQHLERIVRLCKEWNSKLTLVVYPWPNQIAHGDLDSIQVRYWQNWSAQHDVRFINGFPPFFRESKEVALHRYFIAGDMHFNAAGHRLLFDTVAGAGR